MDRKLLLNAIDAIDAAIEAAEINLRHAEASITELRDRRSELIHLIDPPKIIDYRQERWQFR
jgi:hypothetical protein